MLDEAQDAITRVEDATGKRVLVTDEPSLSTMAAIQIARGSAEAHVLRYNPKHAAMADYLIAFQCGTVCRLYEASEESRFELAASPTGRQEVGRLVGDHLEQIGLSLPENARSTLRDRFYDGLMQQLRSVPIGLRVDSRIRRSCVALRDQQEQAVRIQLEEGRQALGPEVKRLAPGTVYDASVAMNAAFAYFWAQVLGDPTTVVPFRLAGYLVSGERLARVLDQFSEEAEEDWKLIQSWGTMLEIVHWYQLVPFEGHA